LITIERESASAEQLLELRESYKEHASSILLWADRESSLLHNLTSTGSFSFDSWSDLERGQEELSALQNRQRAAETHLVNMRQLIPQLASSNVVVLPLPLAEAAWHSVVAFVPLWQQEITEAHGNLKKREQLEREISQRIRALEGWLIETEATLQQLRNSSSTMLQKAHATAKGMMSQQKVRGHELAYIERLEVQLLAAGAHKDGSPLMSHAVETRYEAWRKEVSNPSIIIVFLFV